MSDCPDSRAGAILLDRLRLAGPVMVRLVAGSALCVVLLTSPALHAADTGDADPEIKAADPETDAAASDKDAADSAEGSDSDDAATEKRQKGFFGRAVDFADNTQEAASRGLTDFMGQVDGYFGDDETLGNDSWARIRVESDKPAGEDIDLGFKLKLRLALPNTEDKLRLLISTGDDGSGQQKDGLDRLGTETDSTNESASLAVEFVRTARENADVNFDLGARQRHGEIQLFTRLKTSLSGSPREAWFARLSNNYTYYSKSGFEDQLGLVLRRDYPLFEDLYFQSSSELSWIKGRKGAVFGQIFGLYAQFSDREFLALENLTSYHTALSGDIEDNYRGTELRLRWRHSTGRKWFFYEVWPSVAWPANSDYDRSYGILLRMEVFFGSDAFMR